MLHFVKNFTKDLTFKVAIEGGWTNPPCGLVEFGSFALRAFCINRTQNLLTEAGAATLQQRPEIKIANMVVKIMANSEHPIN
jgi:hypothetical protein